METLKRRYRMITLQEKLKQADSLVEEINQYFKIQTTYFSTQDNADLVKLRVQQKKVKEIIERYRGKEQ